MLDLNILLKERKYRMLKVLPQGTRVIIMPIKSSGMEKLDSGLIIPNAVEDRTFGVVVALGAEIPEDSEIALGHVVYYNEYAAVEIKIGSHTYAHLKECDVLARLDTQANEIVMYAGRVLILPDEPVTKTIGGIIIPEESIETPVTGTIVALGSKLAPGFAEVQRGQRILYHKYGGSEILYKAGKGKKRFLAIRETETMALIED